jgi:predicted dehydrogenase
VVARPDVDAVIICTPTASHSDIALAALAAGKHVLCEKPLARDSAEAASLLEAARRAGICHVVGFNYRRLPAMALAKKWISEGRLGEIRHLNAVYLQDWSNLASAPFNWRHDLAEAGPGEQSGHIVDLARYLVGEIESVTGAQETVIPNRPVAGGGQRKVTTEDLAGFMARFDSGAVGTFFSSRVAFGEKNALRLSIYGSKGSLRFDLERLNELQFCSDSDPADASGFRNVLVTQPDHPYLHGWWPPGHALGWEHSFVHQARDFVMAAKGGEKMVPDFRDGLECIAVLEAVADSAKTRAWASVRHSPAHDNSASDERRSK